MFNEVFALFGADSTKSKMLEAYKVSFGFSSGYEALTKVTADLNEDSVMAYADKAYWFMADKLHNELPYDPTWFGNNTEIYKVKILTNPNECKVVLAVMIETGMEVNTLFEKAIQYCIDNGIGLQEESVFQAIQKLR